MDDTRNELLVDRELECTCARLAVTTRLIPPLNLLSYDIKIP
jgi:hypothetical protein